MRKISLKMKRSAAISALLCLASCAVARNGGDRILRQNALLVDDSSGDNWPAYGRTYGESHFSPLNAISSGNVAGLKLAAFLDLPDGPVATQPVMVEGVIYMSSGLSVVRAVDAVTGRELWRYDPQVAQFAGKKLRQGWGSRGIAYWNGKVYTGTIDGRLIAVDVETGKPVWSALTTLPNDGRYITGAPRVFNGRVVIGHGGADSSNVRGYVTAYDAESGKQLWRFFTVPGNPAEVFESEAMERAARTWHGEWWKYGGGGNVWNAMTYDVETDTLYIGTGNGAPWNWRIRSQGKGDNLYLASIVALDGKTGSYRWHYQMNPGEMWDYNAAMDMHLADITMAGKKRKVIMQAPKNGFLYVIDRLTGELLAANKIAKVTWADRIDLKTGRPVENPGARFPDSTEFEMWPSYTGAHSAAPSAYDPTGRMMFIPLIERGAIYNDRGIDQKNWSRMPDNAYDFGVNATFAPGSVQDPLDNTSYLMAVDPVTGRQAWKVRTPRVFNGGLMVTAGGLVFQGQNDGIFAAYDSATGARLWQFDAQAPVIGAPITYTVKGKQYIAVVAGMGTSASNVLAVSGQTDVADYRSQSRRVLIFSLDGGAALPARPVVAGVPDDPEYVAVPVQEKRGEAVYGRYCFGCHGPNGEAGGGAPKLTRSPIILSPEAFRAIVSDGSLVDNGMPRFSEISASDLEDMRQYLRGQAKQRLPAQ